MKKFLSICLVALCSISAMYAQETPNPSTDSRTGVACGTLVTVEATSKTGFYHFVEWQIQNNGNVLETVAKNGSTQSAYGASVNTTVNNNDGGKETSTLTLNSLSSALIDAATSGTVTFEAFFEIDQYTITGTPNDNSMGEVTGGGTTTGSNSVTLTATVKSDAPCARFDHWELDDENHTRVPGNNDNPNQLTVTPEATWAHGSEHKYIAVFVTKTVNITVTTADNNKGTVRIVTPAAQ